MEEGDELQTLLECFAGYLKWPTMHIIMDKPSPNSTSPPIIPGIVVPSPYPNIHCVGSPPRISPLGLCNPISAMDVQEEHMLEE